MSLSRILELMIAFLEDAVFRGEKRIRTEKTLIGFLKKNFLSGI